MPDQWQRWLRQQVDLGGAEAILSGARMAANPPAPQAASAPNPPSAPPKWLAGAPPVPEAGFTVDPPGWGLVDDLPALDSLAAVAGRIAGCTLCPLCQGRTNTVPGEGDPAARLMLVGEGPGQHEDASGRPFVGAAGALLDSILSAIDLPRERVFIANVVKCRPPKNRTPLPDEQAACLPYLRRQIELVRPEVLLALGATAGAAMLGTRSSLGQMRNRVHCYAGIPLVITYHPAALLRNPNWKRPTWDDVRIARQLLDA